MKRMLCSLTAGLLVACQPKIPAEMVQPEYPDWYTMRAPVNRAIEAVWGDIDKTLLISTTFAIYRSTDRGKNWQEVHKQSIAMFGVTKYRDTLFTANGLLGYRYVVTADNYSVDDGKTWQPYKRFNPMFEMGFITDGRTPGVSINPVTAPTGETYKIRQYFFDDTTKVVGRFETPGVVTSTGRRIDLPQLHQLSSLYLDEKNRLYLAGSDAVCDGRTNFHFCTGGNGFVYVSKKALPY